MPLDAANVLVAVTGAVYTGPTTLPAPVQARAVLPAGWLDLGYVSSEGINESYDEDSSEVRAWQGGTVVRRVISKSEAQLAFQLIESKRDVLELYHKGSKIVGDGAGGYRLDVLTPRTDIRSFTFDVVDGDTHERLYVARGEVIERGEITYVAENAIGYQVTVTAYPVGDVVLTKLSDHAAWAPAAAAAHTIDDADEAVRPDGRELAAAASRKGARRG